MNPPEEGDKASGKMVDKATHEKLVAFYGKKGHHEKKSTELKLEILPRIIRRDIQYCNPSGFFNTPYPTHTPEKNTFEEFTLGAASAEAFFFF